MSLSRSRCVTFWKREAENWTTSQSRGPLPVSSASAWSSTREAPTDSRNSSSTPEASARARSRVVPE